MLKFSRAYPGRLEVKLMQPQERAFKFKGFTLDLRRGCLRGPDGEIELRPKSFEILRYLVENAGRLVPKNEIMNVVWPNVIVTGDSLARCVSDVRLALGDRGQRIIRTVPRRGYLFAVPTCLTEAEAISADRPAGGFGLSDNEITTDDASGVVSMRDPAPNRDPSGPALLKAGSRSSERRQLTVICCGLVGSTALASRLDPEDLRVLFADYHRCCIDLIGRFGGMVAAFSGDRVLAYFGYPEAHENDAERAVRSGLALIDAVAKLALPLAPSLHLRVGIASGLVVLGSAALDEASGGLAAIGEAPGLAAQLQSIATTDAVVIAASTRDLARGLFDYRELGRVSLEGLAEPVAAWQVVGTSGAESRFEALRDGRLTPLIGRDEEIDLLLRRWQQIQSGEGRVVLISGEPGIGKSRLVRALRDRSANATVLSFYCSPIFQDTPLFPVITQLERIAGFSRSDTSEERLAKFEALVDRSIGDEAIALIAALLSLQTDRYPPPDVSPQRRRERTLHAVIAQLDSVAGKRPVLAVFEDAHWMDPTTLELLDLIVDRARDLPVLLLVTHRPEFAPPWASHAHATTLVLNRLGNREVGTIADYVTGKRLPRELYEQIIDLSDGVPLFVEELVKTVLESGLLLERDDEYLLDGPVPPFAIPNTLQGLLTARLDRLGPAKEAAQIGAALGREFSYELIRAVADWLPEHRLQEALQSLVRSELVYCRGSPPDAIYLFKHALLQDAACETLLRSRRRELHARIAAVLEERFPEITDQQPQLLAHHFTEAGLVEEAVTYWGKAGRRSADRSAMAEAATQFQKGLDQLALLPDNPERRRQELEFHAALGAVLMIVKGYGAPETGQAYTRARELWGELGSPSEVPQARFGELIYYNVRGDLALSLRLAEDLLRLSIQREDSGGIVLGHASCGGNLFYMGQFARSRSDLEKALARYDPTAHRSLVDQVGFHPQVRSQAQLGLALFCLGYSDQAFKLVNAATAAARRLSHLPTLANALGWRTLLWLVGGDARLGEAGDELATVATEQDFPQWRAFGTIYHGWARVKAGDVAEGLPLLRSGSGAFRATGAEVWAPHNIALLARACELAGRIEEALRLFDEAVQIVGRTGERWFAAELNRQKGDFLLRRGHPENAEELYHEATKIAVEQGARLWELRAAVSLARLWRDQGRRAEAGERLAQVYDALTEGFDIPDLREAKALRDELIA
jgi:class 3 adenylate cyclase/predicted ATPase